MTSHLVTVTVFAVLFCALLGLEVVARIPGSPVPRTADLLRAAPGRRSVQVLILLAWWWVGWHFFAAGG